LQGLSFSKDKDSINFLSSDAIMLVAIVSTAVVVHTRLPKLLETTKFIAILAAAGFAAKMYIDRRPALLSERGAISLSTPQSTSRLASFMQSTRDGELRLYG
jgi:hypothetical protein